MYGEEKKRNGEKMREKKGTCEVLPNPLSLKDSFVEERDVLNVTSKEIGSLLGTDTFLLQCSTILIVPAIEKLRNRIKWLSR